MRLVPIRFTALAVVLLAGCATPAPGAGSPPGAGTPPPAATLPPPAEDTCGAAAYASYVGRDHRQVPQEPAGRDFRVVCTTCPMTKDYSAQRLNFFYDTASGKVTRLTCG